MKIGRQLLIVLLLITGSIKVGWAASITGSPSNYLSLLSGLTPGDTLLLEAGIYQEGLSIRSLNGKNGNPITITGPETGPRAVFWGRQGANTVNISNSSYIVIKNLELDGRRLDGDGVYADGNWVHHITLYNLLIYGYGADQQIVGISTKAPAWNWVISHCVIRDAGTGMYLGNSDGSAPFINGIIEYNMVVDTIGYNIQIKHQITRPVLAEIPQSGTTIIRHNVFSKANNSSSGGAARPNLLVGHWPLSGAGADDYYQIYGNFFYQNPYEALFQGEGNIALYNNLFVNTYGDAVNIQPHNDVPRLIRVFNNTVVAKGVGISITGGSTTYQQKSTGNASFAATPIKAPDQKDNIVDSFSAAANYLINPTGSLGQLDLYPKPGMLKGTQIDTSSSQSFLDWNHDFNGDLHNGLFRGAYAGEGQNPGWKLNLETKMLTQGDFTPPASPTGLMVK